MGSAPSGSTATLKALRKPAASNAWFHQLAPSISALRTSSGAPGSTQYSMGFTGSLTGGVGIFLLEAMAVDEALHHGLADGHAVIDEGQAAVAGARIVFAGV
jgi:hypothetical protein